MLWQHKAMKTYLVGGAVRDELLGYPYHENDWVVVGATVVVVGAAVVVVGAAVVVVVVGIGSLPVTTRSSR